MRCGSIRHVIPPVCIFYMQTQNEPLWLAGLLAIYIDGHYEVRKQLAWCTVSCAVGSWAESCFGHMVDVAAR